MLKKNAAKLTALSIAIAALALCIWFGFRSYSKAKPQVDNAENRQHSSDHEILISNTSSDFDNAAIRRILLRLIPNENPNLSSALHLLHVFGPETTLGDGPSRRYVLGFVFDGQAGDSFFGSKGMLRRTQHGARYATFVHGLFAKKQENREAHPSQVLCVCGSLGVPIDRTIHLSDGSEGTLRMVLDDVKANFRMEGDYLWDVMALAYYQCPESSWKDKFGKKHSFDDVVLALVTQDLSRTPCAGSHVLQSLLLLHNVNTRYRILSPASANHVVTHLRNAVQVLIDTQTEDGFWEPLWLLRMPNAGPPPQLTIENDNARILVTGHMLEFLIQVPTTISSEKPRLKNAAAWLLRTQDHLSSFPEWRKEMVCPASHAAKAVAMFAGIEPRLAIR